MAIDKLRPSFTFTEDRLAELRAVVPEAFADGAVNWEALREALGTHLEDEGREVEHFGLNWPGKRQARRLAAQPSKGTLLPAPGEGVDEANTRNLFIDGDNLEVLKLLQKSYTGRVKMIFIDPPYNTGNDFVYRDDFGDSLAEYLRKTNQVDEVGDLLATNPNTGGRKHSNWLSMMYPRILLARQLLREDGVLLLTIDDGEVAHLKLLLNELFGEENFVGHIVWQKRYVSNVTAQFLSDMHDHILVYAKQREMLRVGKLPRTEEQLKDYKNPDNDPRGPWRAQDLSASKPYSAGQFTITTPAGLKVTPPPGRYWRCNAAQYDAWLTDNRIWFGKGGQGRPMLKAFLSEVQDGLTPNTWWSHEFAGHNKEATLEVKELFDGAAPFDTPKPVKLVRRALELFASNDAIVMDFFAGSATTAHAVLELNRVDGGNRKFLMVQFPEPVTSPDYQTIADIAKDRIRRVSQRLKQDAKGKLDLHDRETPEDLGFRVYKLGRSNYKAWQDYQGGSVEDLETLFDRIETPLVDGWKRENVLSEVLLLQGFPLDSVISDEPSFKGNRIQRVDSDAAGHRLFVCLDDEIADATIEQLQLAPEDVFVCLDSALSDEAKLRLGDRCTLRVI